MKNNKKIFIEIFAFTGVFVFLFSFVLKKQVNNLDEIWNFNISNQIANGLTPYKDISMITTPFFAGLIAIFLKFFSNELIIFRFLTAIVSTLICFFTYKIFQKLINKKIISLILTSVFVIIYYEFFSLDYNFGMLLINLIILFIELKNRENENNKRKDLFVGILAMLAFLTKQTIGLFIILEVIIFKLIKIKKKEDIGIYFKEVGIRILGMIIPASIFLIYLISTNSFHDFISYTLLSINTFSNNIPYFRLLESTNSFVKIASLANPVFLIIVVISIIILEKKHKLNELKILYISALSMLIIVYPIADNIHFLISIYISLILFLYLVYKLLILIYKKIKWNVKKYILISIETFLILVFFAEVSISVYRNINEYNKTPKNTSIKHLSNLIIDENLTNRINEIINFENSKNVNVYVLDAEAALYHIPQDKYYKNYDMFNKGNFGEKGESGIIEHIKKSENCIYLIRSTKFKTNWQHPSEVTKYIKENLNYQGDINIFNIYYKE